MTLLRLGDETAGLDALRRAWKRDPYDVRTYNLLNLYEKVIPARYTTVDARPPRAFAFRPRSARRDHRGRRPVPGGALPRLRRPLRLRAAGPGDLRAVRRSARVRGAHGRPARASASRASASAGSSRRRRPRNHAFNWGMVLTHELAHVFAIQLSRSRVPRWFTEGLSELETARLRPEWTRHDDAALYAALRQRRACRRWPTLSNAFVTRAGRRGGARLRARGAWPSTFSSAASASRRCARRWSPSAAASPRPRCSAKMTGLSADALEREFRAELARRFAPLRQAISPARSPCGPPPAGGRRRPAPATGPRGASARSRPAISTRRRRRSSARGRCPSRPPTSRRTRCSSPARSRSPAATPTPPSPRSRACSTPAPRRATATRCACGWAGRDPAQASRRRRGPPAARHRAGSVARRAARPAGRALQEPAAHARSAGRAGGGAAPGSADRSRRQGGRARRGESRPIRRASSSSAPIAIFIDPADAGSARGARPGL